MFNGHDDAPPILPDAGTEAAIRPVPAHAAAFPDARPAPRFTGLLPPCELLRILADATRLRLLMALANGERNVGSLCEELDRPQPTISHHLALLRHAHLLTTRRDAKHVFYDLDGRVAPGDGGSLTIQADQMSITLARTAGPQSPPRAVEPSAS